MTHLSPPARHICDMLFKGLFAVAAIDRGALAGSSSQVNLIGQTELLKEVEEAMRKEARQHQQVLDYTAALHEIDDKTATLGIQVMTKGK